MNNNLQEVENIASEISRNETNENYLKEIIDLNMLKEITKDEETFDYLKMKSFELFEVQKRSSIEMGKILDSVFEKLNGQGSKKEGLYDKWVKANGISKNTALRLRRRYELFKSINSENRNIIGYLPQNLIDKIYSSEKRNDYIDNINLGISIDDIKELLKDEVIDVSAEPLEITEKEEFNYELPYFTSDFKTKAETLDEKKKKKLQEYIKKIEELLK